MKFGSLYPHYSQETWKSLSTLNSNTELKFKSWTLKAIDNNIFFLTPCSEVRLNREACKSAFEKASGDELYFCQDVPYLT
jgi:hypothetical protein